MTHSQSQNPPFIVGLLGAIGALWISEVSVVAELLLFSLGSLLIGVFCFQIVVSFIQSQFENVREWYYRMEWYNRPDSRLVSWYYRVRAKILYKLGRIGRN